MIYANLKKADSYEIEKWLEESIPYLTDSQKYQMRAIEIGRFTPFVIYRKVEPELPNMFWRFMTLLFPAIWLILALGLPLNMLATGGWGYKRGFLDFIGVSYYLRKCNL